MTSKNSRKLRVFLSYTSEDKTVVSALQKQLEAAGIQTWFDVENILAGQSWRQEISNALRESDAVLVCLSTKAISKRGYMQIEVTHALDILQEKPKGDIFLIPVRLEPCEVPQQLMNYQWVNLYERNGYERLIEALRIQARSLGVLEPKQNQLDIEDGTGNLSLIFLKIRRLEERLKTLLEEYHAVSGQFSRSSDPINRLRLRRQLENVEKEIALVEIEINSLSRASETTVETTVETSTTTYNLSEIRAVLLERFDLEELMQISIEMGLADQLMFAGSPSTLASNLVEMVSELGRIEELLFLMEQRIPDLKLAPQQREFLAHTEHVRRFLEEAGFQLRSLVDFSQLIAIPRMSRWSYRFPKGLYVAIWVDELLNKNAVREIYRSASKYNIDYALVVVNRQPTEEAWFEIGGLRAKAPPFFLLAIDDTQIRELIFRKREAQGLGDYFDKKLGNQFDPYDARDPVSDAISFFGRSVLTLELTNMLYKRCKVGIFGIHKMGKSSILLHLQRELSFPVAYIYCRIDETPSELYQRIVRAWERDLRLKQIDTQWKAPKLRHLPQARASFEDATFSLIEELETIDRDLQLAIFLDEVDKIVSNSEEDHTTTKLYLEVMDTLRGIHHETDRISYLVAGIHPTMTRINFLQNGQKNPMHQVFDEIFLQPLDQESCDIMIRSLGAQRPEKVTYDLTELDYIFSMSGGHPFLARRLCSEAIGLLGSGDRMSLSLLEQAAEEFVRNPATASYFDERALWYELSASRYWGKDIADVNVLVLRALAHASLEGLTETEIESLLKTPITSFAIMSLKERHVISLNAQQRYFITFGLFRNWIRRNSVPISD